MTETTTESLDGYDSNRSDDRWFPPLACTDRTRVDDQRIAFYYGRTSTHARTRSCLYV